MVPCVPHMRSYLQRLDWINHCEGQLHLPVPCSAGAYLLCPSAFHHDLKHVTLEDSRLCSSVKGSGTEMPSPRCLSEGVNSKENTCCDPSQEQMMSKVIPEHCQTTREVIRSQEKEAVWFAGQNAASLALRHCRQDVSVAGIITGKRSVTFQLPCLYCFLCRLKIHGEKVT